MTEIMTRKEIASILSVSVDTVRRNEKELGLFQCRLKICKRPILYHREQAQAILLKLLHAE